MNMLSVKVLEHQEETRCVMSTEIFDCVSAGAEAILAICEEDPTVATTLAKIQEKRSSPSYSPTWTASKKTPGRLS